MRRAPHRKGRHAAPRVARSRAPGADVLLAWARDRDGAKVYVGALEPERRRDRAPFSCPACGEELVARLGAVRARHFAHRPGSTCPLARPETALHRNAKERLLFLCAEAFASRLRVTLSARCPRCRRPTPIDLAGAGDAALAEAAAGAMRCDVLVTRGGAPAIAFEVKVTHAVDAAKEAALSGLGLAAIEIDAREPWEEEGPGGVAVRASRTLGFPPCPACEVAARADEGRAEGGEAAAVAELEAYRARGLIGPRPGSILPGTDGITAAERLRLEGIFRCPECGSGELVAGARLVRHPCPKADLRPVAWRGYDGVLVELAWWRASGRRAPEKGRR